MIHFFSTLSKKGGRPDFSEVSVDMHSHLLPGIDDGAKNTEDSIRLINGLQELGFEHFITTPHTMKELYPNSRESIEASFQVLRKELSSSHTLSYSSEYFLDEYFMELMEEDKLVTLPGNRILLEFSQISKPMELEEQLFQIHLKGYKVILAHPERYLFFHQKMNFHFPRLKDMDIDFQVNALSLSGYYGESIRKVAEKLIADGMVEFIGSDTHHDNHLKALAKVQDNKYYQKLLDSGKLQNRSLLTTNARVAHE